MKLLTLARSLMLMLFAIFFSSMAAYAQTTFFTYQGRLTDTTLAASAEYDLQFSLYDESGAQIGTTITRNNVTVSNGIFTVQLDFGQAAFPGANRLIEIAVRRGAETGLYTTLTPRQPITSAPYSIRAINATNAENALNAVNAVNAVNAAEAQNSQQLGGTPANQFVQTDTTLFIRNRTMQQTSANFNIDGIGGANIFAAGTQFNIGSDRILTNAGTDNLFAGVGAGASNTQGENNSFVGFNSGASTTQGIGNSFFGRRAGFSNTTGSNNTIVGQNANVGSGSLTFAAAFGAGAIVSSSNTVVLGRNLDTVNVPGNLNVTGTLTGNFTVPTSNITGVLSLANGGTGLNLPGTSGNFLRSNGTIFTSSPLQPSDFPAGIQNYLQNTNTPQPSVNFNIGGNGTLGGTLSAGIVNTTTQFNLGGVRVLSNSGLDSLFAGVDTGVNTTGAANAFFGAIAGFRTTTGGVNSFFGTRAGEFTTTGNGNSFFGTHAGDTNTTGSFNTILGESADVVGGNLTYATAIGSGATVSSSNTIVLGRNLDDVKVPGDLNVAGTFTVTGIFNLPDGDDSYIQNQNAAVQSSNFNISGNGTLGGTVKASIFNATTKYNIGGQHMLSNEGTNNIFLGIGAGNTTVTGASNTFVGTNAGTSIGSGDFNSFFGAFAGLNNTTGGSNSFFGMNSGQVNTSGANNSFFGRRAGFSTDVGSDNSFFGSEAGASNLNGSNDAFFGRNAGASNLNGSFNSFFGNSSGKDNTLGAYNSFFGGDSGLTNTIGARNSFFGYRAGRFTTSGADNAFFGDNAGVNNITGSGNAFFGKDTGLYNTTGAFVTLLGFGANVQSSNLVHATAIGAFSIVKNDDTIALGAEDGSTKVVVYGLGAAGNTSLCRNGLNQISTCTLGNFTETDGVILFEAVKKQRTQIETQQKQIDELKAIVCSIKPDAAVCLKQGDK